MNTFKLKCDQVFHTMNNYHSECGEKINIYKLRISKDEECYNYSLVNSDGLNDIRSISKLVVCLSLGIAIDNKTMLNGSPLNLNTKIWPLIKDKVNLTNYCNLPKIEMITLKHLLNHTMGFDEGLMFSKNIKNIDPDDLVDYVFNTDIVHTPGEFFVYSNAGSFILSVIIQEGLNQNLSQWAEELLFKKIDINNYQWKNYGKYCAGATGLKLSIEDLHKIGVILTNKGCYNGKRIVSEEWVNLMMSKSIDTPKLFNSTATFPKEAYGLSLWLSKQGKVCYCSGTDGQYLIMIPKERIVITTLGDEKNMNLITECMKVFEDYI